MSVLILTVDEVMRTLSNDGQYPFVVNDKTVDIVRFALNTGFTDVVLDEHSALRVMYQRPGETEVRAQTLTYYDTDGLRNYYDWHLLSADLAEKGTLTVALCILRTDNEVEEWHTTPCQIRVLFTIHTDDSDEGDESITPTVAQRVAVLESVIHGMAGGAPVVVGSVSDMTDTGKLYVLTTDNNWYYYDGSAWVAGGEYGAVSTDTTLTQSGLPADAKAVGDAIAAEKTDVPKIVSPEETEADLYICDSQGDVIGKFVGGHIITKNFNSKNIGNLSDLDTEAKTTLVDAINEVSQSGGSTSDIIMDAPSTADLFFCDSAGNVIAKFVDGHITTKNFDSASIKTDLSTMSSEVEENTEEINKMKRVRTRMEFGAHNGAEWYAPECSIPAYRIAGQQGWEWAWIAGIDFSLDGTMYVIHDDTVDRTTDGTGKLSEMTDTQINALHIDQSGGTRYDLSEFDPAELVIPTFEQVLQQCVRYGMKMVIRLHEFPNTYNTTEAKAVWDNFYNLLKSYGVKTENISCYLGTGTMATICRNLFGEDVEIATFLGASAVAQDFIDYFDERSITGNRAAIINVQNTDLTSVKLLHSNGIRVYVYDSNSVEDASRCASLGVDIFQNGRVYKLTE